MSDLPHSENENHLRGKDRLIARAMPWPRGLRVRTRNRCGRGPPQIRRLSPRSEDLAIQGIAAGSGDEKQDPHE
jgi:hypothetical protein